MSDQRKHYPAAFINAIAEEGTKDEAVEWLQRTWDELCALRESMRSLDGVVVPRGLFNQVCNALGDDTERNEWLRKCMLDAAASEQGGRDA